MAAIRESPGTDDGAARAAIIAAFQKMDSVCMFGPSFFLGQLGQFVRERCPTPEQGLPAVQLGLVDGTTLDICHIVAVSPRWVMLAAPESERPASAMATEFVPYELIRRVTIRARKTEGTAIGFEQLQPPEVVVREGTLARTQDRTL